MRQEIEESESEALRDWISVEDRLPEYSKPVLVYCKIYGRYVTTYENHGEYSEFLDWKGRGGALPPTHWMPLPEPPTGSRLNEDMI